MKKFVAHKIEEHYCPGDNSFWLDDLEEINKDPKFPKVPKSKGARVTPEYRALHNIARRLRPILRASLVKGLNLFRKNIDLHDLAEAISNADHAQAMAVVPWDEFEGAIKGLEKATLEGVADSAKKSKFLFKKSISNLIGVKPDVVFDAENPAIKNWIETHTAELVQNIKENTQKSIQSVISTGLNQGMAPRDSAKLIRNMVGLNDRQAKAVINRRLKLQSQGIKGPKLEKLINSYIQKQIKYRSELIARTEAMTANNRGMMEVANQNADKGLFDRSKARKKWIVTPYDRLCKVCKPMADKEVGIDEQFVLRNGIVVDHPPAHPNCNCSWALILPEDSL